MNRLKLHLFALGVSLTLAVSAIFVPATVQITYAKTIPQTDLELVRNGAFDLAADYGKPTSWVVTGTGSGVLPTAGQDGGPAMQLQGISENQPQLYQQLRLPTLITGVSVAADFRASFIGYPSSVWPEFAVSITTSTSVLVTLYDSQFTADTGWMQVNRALTAGEVSAIQNAHSVGESVFIVFTLYQDGPGVSQTLIDNVSFRVDGSMTIPNLDGSIGFIGLDAGGNPKTVKRIAPDGSGNSVLWTHPSTVPETNSLFDVAWKPDASEVAFSSNHESGYSAFNSDVYGLKPDGSGLRRITNPPGQSDLSNGSFQYGKVKGSIRNDYSSVTTFMVYVEGAKNPVSVNVGAYGDEVGFPELEVADLGVGLHYVVFIWSKGSNANCREYAPAVIDVQAGQTINAGTLSFDGTCGAYDSESISWKRNGAQIAVDVLTPRKFASVGEAIGTALFSGAAFADKVAWSPVDNRVLYRNNIADNSFSGIYMTSDNGDAGTRVVASGGALWLTPAWLPDGSGFVYTSDHEMRQFLFAGSQDTPLAYFYNDFVFNPSVSPDGRYVVFEWQESFTGGNYHNLWVLDRSKPTQMWSLTSDNRSTNPDWSRVNVPPPSSCTTLTGVTIQGPASGTTGWQYTFTASVQPANAATPVTYTWDPKPMSGQGTAQAAYKWNTAGARKITVNVSNCGGSTANDSHTITIRAGSSASDHVYLPAVIRP